MNYDKPFQDEMNNFVNNLPLFAENLRRSLDNGDVDAAVLISFYLTMEVARARLVFESLGDDIIVKAMAPGYTVACLMPRRNSGEPMSYEDLVKLMNSDKQDLNEVR